MGELLAILAVLGLAALVVASPVLAVIALFRARGLERRVQRLERERDRLEAQVLGGRTVASAPAPAAPTPATPATPREGPRVERPAPSTVTPPRPSTLSTPEPAKLTSPAPSRVEPPSLDSPKPIGPIGAPQPSAATRGPAGPPPASSPARPPKPRIAWEQWIGVRGAAVLGGAVLALAAILLVKVAFERQWIGGAARCWLGAAAGVGAIAAAALLRKRDVRVVPNALDGAGVVALFAATWAAHRVWGFFSAPVALVLLSGVTAIACALALRHRSQLTAVLGLVGGFAAAFLLSGSDESPLGLFGYLLLLDLALLFVGRRGGWPSLGLLALLGTFVYESLFVMRDLEPDRILFGLCVLAVFALVFAVGAARRGSDGKRSAGWFTSRAGAVLLPFVFALRFAGASGFQDHIGATFGLVVILGVAACVIARAQGSPWLALGAASGGLAVLAVWTLSASAAGTEPWMFAGLLGGLALLYHAFFELDEKSGAPAAAIASGGALVLACVAPMLGRETSALAWTVALAVPAALLVRQGASRGREALSPIAGALAGLGVSAHGLTRIADPALGGPGRALPEYPSLRVVAATLVLGAAALHVAARLLRAREEARGEPSRRASRFALHAIGLFVAPGLFGVCAHLNDASVLALHASVLLPSALLAVAAARLGSAFWTGVGALILAGLQAAIAWTDEGLHPGAALTGTSAGMLCFAAIAVVAAVLQRDETGTLRRSRAFWIASALSIAPSVPLVHHLYVERFGDGVIAAPYVASGLVVAALAFAAARALSGAQAFGAARAAYAAAAAVLLASALPIQLDFEWPAVALACSALALAVLARRFRAAPLAVFAAAGAIGATLLLVGAALDPRHYERSQAPIASWLSYAHLVPLAALVASAWVLREGAAARRARAAAGLCAIVVGFAWINLSILDVFSAPETRLSFGAERLQTRDLVTSLAWAVYALGLLVAGTALRAGPLRWASLGLMLLTIAKVFLFDLGELDGLLRVASLAGLALSLIAVSLFYQRFVFRRPTAETT